MNPWTVDAREAITDLNEIDYNYIELNEGVRSFLNDDRHYFVIGPKGFGKSLLLLTKRKKLADIHMIPQHLLLDVPGLKISTLNREVLSRLAEKDMMLLIWSMSIVIAIIKRLKLSEDIMDQCSESLKVILANPFSNTVTGVFESILIDINRRKFYEELSTDYNKILLPCARSITKPIAVFVDNVDECFEGYMDLWYDAQNALIRSIYDLVRVNNKFKLYASIRKEAFDRNTSEMFLQYKGVSVSLEYSREELRNIFIQNIKKLPVERLIDSEQRVTNPIAAFIGVAYMSHGIVEEEEKMCDHIFRHTLRRPRDIMEMGGSIYNCDKFDRDPNSEIGREKLKTIINDSAANIAKSYIGEVLPHLTIDKFDIEKVSLLINSNILSKEKLKKICATFNGIDECIHATCKTCTLKHIFCELFKIGLLGHVKQNDIKKGAKIQKFLLVGEKLFDEVGLLPSSTTYLIHPALSEFIRKKNNQFKSSMSSVNIIGYDRPWYTRKQSKKKPKENKISKLPRQAIDILRGKEEINLENYTVVGGYRRFNPDIRAQLRGLCQQITTTLTQKRNGRHNYLICATPGSGKTYLIQEIAKSVCDTTEFVEIDLSKDSKEDVINSLRRVGKGESGCLCMIDEIDGRACEEWPYDVIYKKLDVNEDENYRGVTIFTLIGSSGGNAEGLKDAICSRYKAKDLIDRIPENSKYYIQIPHLELGDGICVYISKVLEASARLGVDISHVEKMAAFHAAMTALKSPRQIKMLADHAVDRARGDGSVLRYDHHFTPGDDQNKRFWLDHQQAVEALHPGNIKIS